MALSEVTKNRLKLHRVLKNYVKDNPTHKPVAKIIEEVKRDTDKHFLSFNEKGGVTYSNKDVFRTCAAKRINTTIGRYVRRHLKISSKEFDDTKLSKFSEYVSKEIKAKYIGEDIEFFTGKDVMDFYKKSVKNGCGSCMTGVNSRKIQIYADNPEKIQLITTKDHKCRGLIWTADNGTKVMSSIYGAKYNDLYAWAKANKVVVGYDINQVDRKKLKFTLRYTKKIFPSVDSFPYGQMDNISKNVKKGTIILSGDNTFGNVTLSRTDGSYNVRPQCVCCKSRIYGYSSVHFDNKLYCQPCAKKELTLCDCCNKYTAKTKSKKQKNEILSLVGLKTICGNCIKKGPPNNGYYGNTYTCVKCNTKTNSTNCIVVAIYNRGLSYNSRKCFCLNCIKLA